VPAVRMRRQVGAPASSCRERWPPRARKQGICAAEIEGRPVGCSLAVESGDETHVVIELPPEAATAAGQMVRLLRARFADAFLLPARPCRAWVKATVSCWWRPRVGPRCAAWCWWTEPLPTLSSPRVWTLATPSSSRLPACRGRGAGAHNRGDGRVARACPAHPKGQDVLGSAYVQGSHHGTGHTIRGDAIDEEALRRLVDEQLRAGIDGFVPVGTTGESPTVTVEEHIRIIKIVVEETRKRVPVICRDRRQLHPRGHRADARARAVAPTALCRSLLTTTGPRRRALPPFQGHRRCGAAAHVGVQRARPHGLRPFARNHGAAVRGAFRGGHQGGHGFGAASGADSSRAWATAWWCCQATMRLPFRCTPWARTVVFRSCPTWRRRDGGHVDAAVAGNWNKARELHYRVFPLSEGLFIEANPIPVKAALAMMARSPTRSARRSTRWLGQSREGAQDSR